MTRDETPTALSMARPAAVSPIGSLLLASMPWALSLAALSPRAAASQDFDADRLKRAVPKIIAHHRKQRDVGAGLVLAVDGDEVLILTAAHVIEDADRVEVRFFEKIYKTFAARVHSRVDDVLDVAIVIARVEDARRTLPRLPAIDLGDAPALAEGDEVFPVGHPLDSSWRISRDNKVEGLTDGGDARQLRFTVGSIDKGSSGGPLFDRHGAFLGMVTRKHPLHGVAVKEDALRALLADWNIPTPNLVPRPVFGTLIVDTRPADATVLLDGEEIGVSAGGWLEIEDVTPGPHSVEVIKPPGYRPFRLEVAVAAGETQRLLASLSAISTRAPFLVMLSAPPDDPGLGSAEGALLDRLTDSGYSVVDRGQVARILTGEGVMEALRGAEPERLAAIAQQHGAEVIVVGRLRSEAQPALGRFHSGGAVLELRCLRASTGQILAAETLQAPRTFEPSDLVARSVASRAVAEMAAEVVFEQVVPGLEDALRLAEGDGESPAERRRVVIVAHGASLSEARSLRDLLAREPGVSDVRQTSFVNGERLELGLKFDGDPVTLGESLHGSVLGERRLELDQAEPRRLTLKLLGS